MTAIAIRPVSSLDELIQVYTTRGYQVLVVSEAWSDTQALARRLAQPISRAGTLVVSSLARRVHEASKGGSSLFAVPTLVLVDDAHFDFSATAWTRIQDAARISDQDVVFVHVPST